MEVVNVEPILNYLKENKFGFYGMPKGDEIDNDNESIEPAAIVAFVLSKLGVLTVKEKEAYINKILDAKHKSGAFYTVNNVLGVWATSQACLALNELGCDKNEYLDSISWLCKSQNQDGGWSYNGILYKSSIIHSFYTVLLLRKFKAMDEVENTLLRNAQYLIDIRDNVQEKPVNRLMALYLLEVMGEKQEQETISLILNGYIEEIIVKKSDEPFIDFDYSNSYNYYIGYYFPASYLLIRKFCSPKDYFAQFLINHLLTNLEPAGCWKPNIPNQGPTSWATVLSLYTLFVWEKDCKTEGLQPIITLSEEVILMRLRDEMEEQKMKEGFVINCPLNQGKCNLKEKIQNEFNEKRVFLDIPYETAYEDIENQIVKTLIDNGLIPVMAKDTYESKIILCKVCQKIQSCKYGIADLTGAKENIYFELGLLYGVSRKCALLKKKGVELPADLGGKEFLEYNNTRELNIELTKWIRDNVTEEEK